MKNKIDISNCKIIDGHCHPFFESTKKLEQGQFIEKAANLFALGITTESQRQALLVLKQMLHELSQFLSCTSDTKDVIKTRNNQSADFREYLKNLYDDVKINTMVVDDGFSEVQVTSTLPHVEFEEFREFVPVKVARVKRIEPLILSSVKKSSSFEDMMVDYSTSLKKAVKEEKCVAFKSIIAYRTGLDIQKTSEDEAMKDFTSYKNGMFFPWLGGLGKTLRDFLICHTFKKSVELNVPVQIHTGLGDADIVVEKCNPVLMLDILKDEEVQHAKIVLLHGGYPYGTEAAWLTSIFPNVYLDVSLYPYNVGSGIQRRIMEILEMGCISKIIYGSDGAELPELHWLGAKMFKKGLSMALDNLIDFGTLRENEAYKVAESILSQNAEGLYNLR